MPTFSASVVSDSAARRLREQRESGIFDMFDDSVASHDVRKERPTITILGANPLVIESASAAPYEKHYIDDAALCIDGKDGDISKLIEVSGSVVQLGVPGTYHVKYSCTNSKHLAAVPQIRTIIVQEAAKPVTVCPAAKCDSEGLNSVFVEHHGCTFEQTGEKLGNGCLKYPCGRLRCKDAQCPPLQEERVCATNSCPHPPVDCEVSKWIREGPCSRTCGRGVKVATRVVRRQPAHGGKPCPSLVSERLCAWQDCPTDCVMASWGPWSTCSSSCGGGQRSRHRGVAVPPAHGGAACAVADETSDCNQQQCPTASPTPAPTPEPVDCLVTAWSSWGTCSLSCGGGLAVRARSVLIEPNAYGHACPPMTQTDGCNTDACPQDCVMEPWGSWSTCTNSCGGGRHTRT